MRLTPTQPTRDAAPEVSAVGPSMDAASVNPEGDSGIVTTKPDGSGPKRDAGDVDAAAADGERMLFKAHAIIAGVTDDNQLILVDDAQNVVGLPLAGGPPTTLSAAPDSGTTRVTVVVDGPSVFIWRNVPGAPARLDVWSRAAGMTLLSLASSPYRAGRLPGAAGFYYVTNSTSAAGDLVVGDAQGGATKLIDHLSTGLECFSWITPAEDRTFVASCPPGSSVASLKSFTAAGVTTTLGVIADTFSWARGGKKLWMLGADATLRWVDDAGSVQDLATGVSSAKFSSHADALVYSTQAGALMRAPLPTGTTVALAAAGIVQVLDFSPSDDLLVVAKAADPAGNGTDLWLTTPAGPATAPLIGAGMGIRSWSGGFTNDGQHFLYQSNTDDSFDGELHAVNIDGTGDTMLSPKSTSYFIPLGPSTVIFFGDRAIDPSIADLVQTDLSTGASRVLAASIIQGSLHVVDKKGMILFARTGAAAGVYALPVAGL